MELISSPLLWFLGLILLTSAFGVIFLPHPVHVCLSFLVTLMSISSIYLLLSAEFIAMMQIWVYAGAILVIFMFVIVLFQDAHHQIARHEARSYSVILFLGAFGLLINFIFLGDWLLGLTVSKDSVPADFGTSQALGRALYVDYITPFESIVPLFIVAVVGALYIARKEA